VPADVHQLSASEPEGLAVSGGGIKRQQEQAFEGSGELDGQVVKVGDFRARLRQEHAEVDPGEPDARTGDRSVRADHRAGDREVTEQVGADARKIMMGAHRGTEPGSEQPGVARGG
jgi:hypothetical protein